MNALKESMQKRLRLVFAGGAIVMAITLGILLTRGHDASPHAFQEDSLKENQDASSAHAETAQPTLICSDLLEEDDNTLALHEYSNAQVVDCMFVGCGGLF